MRHWWQANRIEQGEFKVDWKASYLLLSDYFTKKHPPSHHKLLRLIYLYEEGKSPNSLQGCVKVLKRSETPKAKHDSNRP